MTHSIKLFFLFLIFLITNGYSVVAQDDKSLNYQEFIKKVKETKGTIIDARTPQEYNTGHFQDAVLINYLAPDFSENVGKLDKNGHYFLYCRSGNRTSKALALMQDMGFKHVYHLKGGVIALQQPNVLIRD